MPNLFQPYAVISTEYILPAAAIISCGAKLHDHAVTGEEPCIRSVDRYDSSKFKTIFQFQEKTSDGVKVKDLLEAHKRLDFEQASGLPEDHVLHIARRALAERNRLHLWHQKLLTEPVQSLPAGYATVNTKLAAILVCLGHELLEARRTSERHVAFFFTDSPLVRQHEAAFVEPWGTNSLHPDHVLYHMRGALENRDGLILLLKRASVRVEVIQDGKRFFVPLNATREKLTNIITKLNQ